MYRSTNGVPLFHITHQTSTLDNTFSVIKQQSLLVTKLEHLMRYYQAFKPANEVCRRAPELYINSNLPLQWFFSTARSEVLVLRTSIRMCTLICPMLLLILPLLVMLILVTVLLVYVIPS